MLHHLQRGRGSAGHGMTHRGGGGSRAPKALAQAAQRSPRRGLRTCGQPEQAAALHPPLCSMHPEGSCSSVPEEQEGQKQGLGHLLGPSGGGRRLPGHSGLAPRGARERARTAEVEALRPAAAPPSGLKTRMKAESSSLGCTSKISELVHSRSSCFCAPQCRRGPRDLSRGTGGWDAKKCGTPGSRAATRAQRPPTQTHAGRLWCCRRSYS